MPQEDPTNGPTSSGDTRARSRSAEGAGPRHHRPIEIAEDLAHQVKARAGRSWRRWKWLVRIVVGVPVILALVVLILMRSPVVGWIAAHEVARMSGCRLQSGRSYIDLDGVLVMKDVLVTAPGVPGQAGHILEAQRATFALDWSGIFSGGLACTLVHLTKPTFLISQSTDDGSLNLASLASTIQSGGASAPSIGLPPTVDIVSGAIEFAEHDAQGRVTPLKRIDVDGSFTPTRADKPVYAVRMYEIAHSEFGPVRGMLLDGRVDLQTGSLTVNLMYLPLTAWTPESVPGMYRDLWRRLNIQGEIPRATLTYTADKGMVLDVVLSEVSMNALIPTDDTFHGPHKDLVLQYVNGTVRLGREGLLAQLTGTIEGQPGRSEVTLKTDGLDLDAALSCRIVGARVQLSKNPAFMPYVPPTVRQYFQYFSGPTAEVDAVAVVKRGPPVDGKPADFKVAGVLSFQKGTAAFHKFPYPFHDMEGVIDFDEKTIKILNIRGKGPTGAALAATGVISPLTDDAGVDVTVNVVGAPLDEHLLAAMPESRRRVVSTVFSAAAFEKLLAAGLVRRPNQPGADGTRMAPPFEFGGVCAIDVRVRRKEGPEGDWLTDVDVVFPQAGIVPAPFPLPVIARNLHVHITDDDARLISGEFTGLAGGKADLKAAVTFFENGKRVVKPDIRIAAEGLPIERLLINALPGDDGPGPDRPEGEEAARPRSARRLVRELGVTGTVEASVLINASPNTTTPEDPDVDYDVSVRLETMRAEPLFQGRPSGLTLEHLAGVLRVTRESVMTSDIKGRVVRAMDAGVPPVEVGGFDLDATLKLSGAPAEERGGYSAFVSVSDLDLAQPFERLLGLFSDDAPAYIQQLRAEHTAEGKVDAEVEVMRKSEVASTGPDVRIALEKTTGVTVGAMNGRLSVGLDGGKLAVSLPSVGDARLDADGASLRLGFSGADAGTINLDGFVSIDSKTTVLKGPGHLNAALEGWRFDCPLLPPLVKRLGDASAAEVYQALDPAGEFSARISLSGATAADAPGASRLLLSGFVRPTSLSFSRRGLRLDFPQVTGRVSFESDPADPNGTRGTIDGLVLNAPECKLWSDGEWGVSGPSGQRSMRIDADLGLDARHVDDRVLLLVPDSVWNGLRQISTKVDGPVSLVGGHLVANLGGPPEAGRTSFVGQLEAHDVGVDVGVGIKAPEVFVDVDWPDRNDPGADAAAVDIRLPSASVIGVAIENAHARITRGEREGTLSIPSIEASCHGGKLSGRVSISGAADVPPGAVSDGSPGRSAYQADLMLAGVQFAPVLNELTRIGAAADFVGPLPDERIDPEVSRGQVDARLSIGGVAGDVGSRIGRGAIRIANGQILRLPLVFPLLQVSNLVLPSSDRFNSFEASYHVVGPEAVFENLTIRSRTISLIGDGTLAFPGLALDMHFNSRSNHPIPVLSNVLEAVRDEIVTISVAGTLLDPIISTESFFGTRRVIREILSGGDKPKSRDADQRDAAAAADRERLHRGGQDVPTTPPRTAADQP